jgi:hypothetical protein
MDTGVAEYLVVDAEFRNVRVVRPKRTIACRRSVPSGDRREPMSC